MMTPPAQREMKADPSDDLRHDHPHGQTDLTPPSKKAMPLTLISNASTKKGDDLRK